jgi:hypothetical protein
LEEDVLAIRKQMVKIFIILASSSCAIIRLRRSAKLNPSLPVLKSHHSFSTHQNLGDFNYGAGCFF